MPTSSQEPTTIHRDTVACGAHRLHRITVTPPQPAWCRLAVLHGYGDHAGRFVHFMQWMADRGVACHAIDFRGHGRSTGRPMYIERWEEYLEDLTAFLATEELATTPTAPPLFVLGHSHGGLVAVAAAMEQRLHCRGLILSAPYLDLKMPVPLHKRIVGVIGSWLFPSLPVRSGVGDEPLSRDPEMNADTKADPLCLGIATPRWFTSATAAQADVRARAAQLTLPLLMLVAGDDTIANPQASVEFFDHCGSTDKTMKRYDDFRHEILRELGRERAFEDILAWLQPRALVPSPSGRGLG